MRQIWLFLIFVYVLSWSIWIISGVLSRTLFIYDYPWMVSQIGVFAPAISALFISAVLNKNLRRNSLQILSVILIPLIIPGMLIVADAPSSVSEFPPISATASILVALFIILFFTPLNRHLLLPGTGETHKKSGVGWILLSIIIFPILFLLAWLFVSFPGGIHTPSFYQQDAIGALWTILVVFSHNLLLGGSLGEEIGWRGFLLPRLLEKYNLLAASIFLGIIWGLWHLPIDLYSGYLIKGPAAVIMRIIWVIPLSVIFTWFYLKSKGNLLVALFLHTSLNILPDLNFPNYEVTLIFLFLLFLTVAIFLSLFDPTFKQSLK